MSARTYLLPEVQGDRWTDEFKPTVIGSAPCRVAAEAILFGLEWGSIYCDQEGDVLTSIGTIAWLDGTVFMRQRDENTLIAWLASRLRQFNMCMTDGHEDDEGTRVFNDCYADDGDSEHEWESWWAIDADPDEFWAFVQQVARR